MDLAYLLVGVAKNEEKDFKELYRLTQKAVFALSLALVKDRLLARDICAETYKRVKTLAYSYDTDTNAEYWILEITKNLCINSLHDKDVAIRIRERNLDNVSTLLKDLITGTGNDRGAIIVLTALSGLSIADIANLLWYYTLSARNEYRRGIREIKKKEKTLKKEKDIKEAIDKDISSCLPNTWDLINSDKPTMVSYISHEAMGLTEEELSFEGFDAEHDYIKRLTQSGRKAKKTRYGAVILLILFSAALISFVTFAVYRNYQENLEKEYIGTEIALVEIDGIVYYQNYADKSKLYSYHLGTGKKVKLCDDFIKELATDGEYLFYRNRDDGRIYRINKDGTDKIKISQTAGSSILVYGGYLYYSSPSSIIRMKKDGSEPETVITIEDEAIFRYDMAVDNGTVYFSGGAGNGIYYVVGNNGEADINALYFDQAYDIQIDEGFIYFNVAIQQDSAGTGSLLYRYDLIKGEYSEVTDIHTGTGAYYISGGEMYFDGYVKSASGIKEDKGIYKCVPGSGSAALLIPRNSTDIYVSESFIYSYNNEKGGSLVVYDRNDINKSSVIF